MQANIVPGAIAPERCYQNARAAIDFLQRAFGFRPALVIPRESGEGIAHAELWAGRGCMMLADLPAPEAWNYVSPATIGGCNTGAPYLATSEVDALYERALLAGCAVVAELADTDYGSRDFSVTDGEGFLWHFGSYRPDGPATGAANGLEAELFAGARYADARAAIAWLGAAFGAVEQFVVAGEGSDIAHAQLLLGAGIIMLGTERADHFKLRTPRQMGGAYTQTLNVTIADPDAHCARAVAAGAQIVRPLADTPYGARGYVALDPEGYVWNFSTYAPARLSSA